MFWGRALLAERAAVDSNLIRFLLDPMLDMSISNDAESISDRSALAFGVVDHLVEEDESESLIRRRWTTWLQKMNHLDDRYSRSTDPLYEADQDFFLDA